MAGGIQYLIVRSPCVANPRPCQHNRHWGELQHIQLSLDSPSIALTFDVHAWHAKEACWLEVWSDFAVQHFGR